jgi:serine/threonine protein kinase/Tol biopolymer transport system component
MSAELPPNDLVHLSSLVDALLDAPREQRATLLAELCRDDEGRRAELEALIAELDEGTPLPKRPGAERFAALLEDDLERFPRVLAEKYRLTKVVGRGGMATVYLARDIKHARDVAVKVVHPVIAAALGSERFLREIEIVAQLRHPHIVPLFDSGDADGDLYYVMPFEAGQSLRERLSETGALPIDDAVMLLRDICDALAHAHAHGIVHRDIKPDNVMLSGRHAMVTDFGIAKALATNDDRPRVDTASHASASNTTSTVSDVLGTPAYMSPEQITGDPVDRRADIYSVGALAYELIAGSPPFNASGRDAVLAAHLSQPAPSLQSARPDVPPALAALVATCLAKRPEDRWQNTDELVRRLERIASSGSNAPTTRQRRARIALIALGTAAAVTAAAMIVRGRDGAPNDPWQARWANAHVERLTDFPGSEVDAAISADGQFATFLADQDSVFDVFVTRIGSGAFTNLTRGRFSQLFNEDVRNVGFSGDAEDVSVRIADLSAPASVWRARTSGGPLRPFLGTAVMAVWSSDGARVAYHETTPGDPIYVADTSGKNARRVLVTEPGTHNHHLNWSPDGRYLYFSHGLPPNDMDVWRVPVEGGQPERITTHASRVAYPVMLDDRTLLYTATADDGSGPWLYSMDLDTRQPTRVIRAVEHYISIAAAAEAKGSPRRLVATVSNPEVGLWSVPLVDSVASEESAQRVAVPTARSAAPRFAPDGSVMYLASRGGADAVWRLSSGNATEIWRAPVGEIAAGAAVSPNGQRVCFPLRARARSTLTCISADGQDAKTLADSLDVRGPASWSPDGRSIVVAAKDGPRTRVYRVPVDGGPPVRLTDSVSSNPVWSPNGKLIVYSGIPRARSVPLKAITPDGTPYALPSLLVDRVGDSYRFVPGTSQLVVKLGGFRRQDLWLVDVETGRQRRLTSLRPGESLHRFDVSPDGKRIVFERIRENSDIALIALPPAS